MAGAETGITFKGFLKASGQAEVWDDTDEKKFSQFGWRTKTTESAYSTNTLIGNWNEEKFDLSKLSKTPAPPSQYDHYFSTTYKESFVKSPPTVPEVLRRRHDTDTKAPTAFPAHQSVLDHPELKQHYNAFITTSMEAYTPPPTEPTDS